MYKKGKFLGRFPDSGKCSYGLTRATTHSIIGGRIKEGIKCLNLSKLAEDMKVTKQRFETIHFGHRKVSGTKVRQ